MSIQYFTDMDEATYHASKALSLSGMKTMLRQSPRHYEWQYLEGNQVTNEAMMFGRAFHCAILEPERFTEAYAVAPSVNMATKSGALEYLAWIESITRVNSQLSDDAKLPEIKAQIARLKERFDGEIIDADTMHLIEMMADEVRAKNAANHLLSLKGYSEVSLFWEEEGVALKSRFDFLSESGAIVDVKTSQDASPDGFTREAYKYGYHMQAYWYMRAYRQVTGKPADSFTFIACDKKAPHCVGVYKASDEMLELGEIDCMKALEIYRECVRRQCFHAYPDMIIALGLPRYAENRLTYGD